MFHQAFDSHIGRNTFTRTLSVILVYLWFPVVCVAQNIKYTDGNTDQSMRGSLNVDPSTLGMTFSVALRNYPGRGTEMPVTLNYSSKAWRLQHFQSIPYNNGINTSARPKFSEQSVAGWTTSLDVPYWDSGGSQIYDPAGEPLCLDCDPKEPGPSFGYFVERIYLHMPGGSTHEMRKSDIPVENCLTGNPETCGAPPITGIYYSVDGSRMKFDVDLGTLYLPDGSRYEGLGTLATPSSAVIYTDRNGNTITIDLNPNSPNYRKWTDTTGRVVELELKNVFSGAQFVQTVTLPGFGAQNLSYVLTWKKLNVMLGISENEMPYSGSKNCSGFPYTLLSPYLFASGESVNHICGVPNARFNPAVLAELRLPTQQSYLFSYNQFGEITKVELPTGGYYRYEYEQVPGLDPDVSLMYSRVNRGVIAHYVCENGGCTPQQERVWNYAAEFPLNGVYKTVVTNSIGAKAERQMEAAINSIGYGLDDPRAGHAREERTYSSGNQLIRRTLMKWEVATGPNGAQRDARAVRKVEVLLDTTGNPLSATTAMDHDGDLNEISMRRYDYVAVDWFTAQNAGIDLFPFGSLLRTEESVYLVNDSNLSQTQRDAYRARHLLSLPTAARVKDNNTVVAETNFQYDEATYPLLTYAATPTGWIDPAVGERGNVTTVRRWLNVNGSTVQSHPGGSYLETHAQYDQCGSPRKAWDARGKLSEVFYADAFSDGIIRNTFAYATSTKTPKPDPSGVFGSNQELTAGSVYDFRSGKVTSTTDANNQVTTYSYANPDLDPLVRLLKVTLPNNLGETTYSYGDFPGSIYIATAAKQSAAVTLTNETKFDGLGRAWRKGHKESATLWSVTDTEYDELGHVKRVSNPYHAPNLGGAINPSGLWTTTTYDNLNRVLTVVATDGSVTASNYVANEVTVTDAVGKSRRSLTDAMGRLSHVTEDPGASPHLNYQTNYSYDTLGNLTIVDQGGQRRYFFYDSLSRLVRARNPEQDANASLNLNNPPGVNNNWSLGYTYDSAGNLLTRTDARGVVTTYAYDDINRNTTVVYSDGTASIERHYDGATLGKGRFHFNYSGGNFLTGQNVEHSAIDGYDALGRPLTGRQAFKTDGVWSPNFTSSRSYDLAGHVLTQSYPSGRTVNYSYGADGRLAAFSGELGGTSRTYADAMAYAPSGQLLRETFRTATPLHHQMDYNIRLQVESVRLGTALGEFYDKATWNRGRLTFHWGEVDLPAGGSGPPIYRNNGNLTFAEVFVPLDANVNNYAHFSQLYQYDELNRVKSFAESLTLVGSAVESTASQTYGYDRWGNRHSVTGSVSAQSWDATEAAATNRLKLSSGNVCTGTKNGLCYDAAGNVIFDNQLGANGDRSYDAENRMKTATGGNSYSYDADGRRTRRQVGVQTFQQVYGLGGELVAEYLWNGSTAVLQKEYGSGGGVSIVAENAGTVRWLVADHLGTPRMLADQTGNLTGISRHDYLPFGEENLSGTVRQGNGYQPDGVRQKFTGYERDDETGLDFAQARYYANVQGRFTSVDPLHSSGAASSPQSWNRYVYVGNHPLTITDPSGLIWARFTDGSFRWFSGDELCDGSLCQRYIDAGWTAVTGAEDGEPYTYAIGNELYTLDPRGPNPSAYGISRDAWRGWWIRPVSDAVIADGSEIPGAFFGGGLGALASRLLGEFFGGIGGGVTTLGLSEGIGSETGVVAGQAGRVVFSGHGGYEVIGNGMKYEMGTGMVTVPEGTSVTVYTRFGQLLREDVAQSIEQGAVASGQFSRTYTSGMSMPNYTLFPVDGPMRVTSGAVTVAQPTRLSGLLTPNMGSCHWAACTAVIK